MLRVLQIILTAAVVIHGLIHLLGFAAYWPLAKVAELPYKTSLLGGRLELGAGGMRLYSVLWLLTALGFVIAAIALAARWPFWAPLMLGAVLLSIVLCIPDWSAAFRGFWIDVVLLLVLGVVFGLRVQPEPFPSYTAQAAPVKTVPLPAGLPKPVERFYRQTYGDQVPVYHSAVISGRGTARLAGLTFPTRLRFSYDAGKAYRHYIEPTFYGIPVLRVNDHYLDGHGRVDLQFQVQEGPHVDSASNQGLWVEMFAFPSVYVTDPRVRWEVVDDTTANMYAPFGDSEQMYTLTFDPQTGKLVRMETMRTYDDKGKKFRWWGEIVPRMGRDGQPTTYFTATWENEGTTPWLAYEMEETVFNSDVSAYIRQTGP